MLALPNVRSPLPRTPPSSNKQSGVKQKVRRNAPTRGPIISATNEYVGAFGVSGRPRRSNQSTARWSLSGALIEAYDGVEQREEPLEALTLNSRPSTAADDEQRASSVMSSAGPDFVSLSQWSKEPNELIFQDLRKPSISRRPLTGVSQSKPSSAQVQLPTLRPRGVLSRPSTAPAASSNRSRSSMSSTRSFISDEVTRQFVVFSASAATTLQRNLRACAYNRKYKWSFVLHKVTLELFRKQHADRLRWRATADLARQDLARADEARRWAAYEAHFEAEAAARATERARLIRAFDALEAALAPEIEREEAERAAIRAASAGELARAVARRAAHEKAAAEALGQAAEDRAKADTRRAIVEALHDRKITDALDLKLAHGVARVKEAIAKREAEIEAAKIAAWKRAALEFPAVHKSALELQGKREALTAELERATSAALVQDEIESVAAALNTALASENRHIWITAAAELLALEVDAETSRAAATSRSDDGMWRITDALMEAAVTQLKSKIADYEKDAWSRAASEFLTEFEFGAAVLSSTEKTVAEPDKRVDGGDIIANDDSSVNARADEEAVLIEHEVSEFSDIFKSSAAHSNWVTLLSLENVRLQSEFDESLEIAAAAFRYQVESGQQASLLLVAAEFVASQPVPILHDVSDRSSDVLSEEELEASIKDIDKTDRAKFSEFAADFRDSQCAYVDFVGNISSDVRSDVSDSVLSSAAEEAVIKIEAELAASWASAASEITSTIDELFFAQDLAVNTKNYANIESIGEVYGESGGEQNGEQNGEETDIVQLPLSSTEDTITTQSMSDLAADLKQVSLSGDDAPTQACEVFFLEKEATLEDAAIEARALKEANDKAYLNAIAGEFTESQMISSYAEREAETHVVSVSHETLEAAVVEALSRAEKDERGRWEGATAEVHEVETLVSTVHLGVKFPEVSDAALSAAASTALKKIEKDASVALASAAQGMFEVKAAFSSSKAANTKSMVHTESPAKDFVSANVLSLEPTSTTDLAVGTFDTSTSALLGKVEPFAQSQASTASSISDFAAEAQIEQDAFLNAAASEARAVRDSADRTAWLAVAADFTASQAPSLIKVDASADSQGISQEALESTALLARTHAETNLKASLSEVADQFQASTDFLSGLENSMPAEATEALSDSDLTVAAVAALARMETDRASVLAAAASEVAAAIESLSYLAIDEHDGNIQEASNKQHADPVVLPDSFSDANVLDQSLSEGNTSSSKDVAFEAHAMLLEEVATALNAQREAKQKVIWHEVAADFTASQATTLIKVEADSVDSQGISQEALESTALLARTHAETNLKASLSEVADQFQAATGFLSGLENSMPGEAIVALSDSDLTAAAVAALARMETDRASVLAAAASEVAAAIESLSYLAIDEHDGNMQGASNEQHADAVVLPDTLSDANVLDQSLLEGNTSSSKDVAFEAQSEHDMLLEEAASALNAQREAKQKIIWHEVAADFTASQHSAHCKIELSDRSGGIPDVPQEVLDAAAQAVRAKAEEALKCYCDETADQFRISAARHSDLKTSAPADTTVVLSASGLAASISEALARKIADETAVYATAASDVAATIDSSTQKDSSMQGGSLVDNDGSERQFQCRADSNIGVPEPMIFSSTALSKGVNLLADIQYDRAVLLEEAAMSETAARQQSEEKANWLAVAEDFTASQSIAHSEVAVISNAANDHTRSLVVTNDAPAFRDRNGAPPSPGTVGSGNIGPSRLIKAERKLSATELNEFYSVDLGPDEDSAPPVIAPVAPVGTRVDESALSFRDRYGAPPSPATVGSGNIGPGHLTKADRKLSATEANEFYSVDLGPDEDSAPPVIAPVAPLGTRVDESALSFRDRYGAPPPAAVGSGNIGPGHLTKAERKLSATEANEFSSA